MNGSLCMHVPRYLMKIISCFILKLDIVINISFIMGYNTLPMYGLSYNNGDIRYRNKFQFYLRHLFLPFLSSDLKTQQSVSFLIFWVVLSVNLSIHLFVFPSFLNINANLNTVLFFFSNECLDRSKNGIKEDRSIKKYSQDIKIYAS